MGIRKLTFTNGEYYHVFNRGVDKRTIFANKNQQDFFFHKLSDLNTTDSSILARNIRNSKYGSPSMDAEKLVSIVAYCLLPNHFHLLLKQNVEQGISQFMQRLGTSYTRYFNQQEKRSGSLFQGKFKAKHLDGDFALPTLSAYVNLNYKHHKINPEKNLVKSSLPEYLGASFETGICEQIEINAIIQESGGLDSYKEYIKQASMSFANNKDIVLNSGDFEF